MQNRIASLFALDELLGAKSNGHNGGGHKRRKRRQSPQRTPNAPPAVKPSSPYGAYAPSKQRKAVAQSFDTGAPIRCEHGMPYAPVEPVQVPSESSPTGAAMSLDTGDGYTVEAFEDEEDEPLLAGLPDLDDDISLDDDSFRVAPSVAHQASIPRRPVREDYERSQPAAFAAQMSAVEQDLAELATRVQQPAATPNGSAATTDEDQTAADTPSPPVSTSGHGVFDSMAKGMSYATEFRLPAVHLSQVFSALDKQIDAEEVASSPGSAGQRTVVNGPVAGAVETVPPNEVLIKDLVGLPRSEPAPATAVAAAAIDVRHDVQLVPQLTGFSCWAAGAAMIVGWRDHMSIDPSEIARATGYWAQYKDGLHPEDVKMFKVWRLTPEAAQTYTVQGFADLLKKHGPLWVASAEPGPHIRVVTGMVGDGTPTGTLVYINDPWEQGMSAFRPGNSGSRYTETYQRFVEKQEELGRREIKLQGIYVAHN